MDVAESQHSYPDNRPQLDLMMQQLARFYLVNLSQPCPGNQPERAFCLADYKEDTVQISLFFLRLERVT